MKRPNIEDYHQDKTGESLMNGPYNRARYSHHLENYVNHLEEKVLNLSQHLVSKSETWLCMDAGQNKKRCDKPCVFCSGF